VLFPFSFPPPPPPPPRPGPAHPFPFPLFPPLRRFGGALGQQYQCLFMFAKQSRERCRGQRNLSMRQDLFLARAAVLLIDKTGIEVTRHETRMAKNPLVKRNIGFDAA